jgi:4-amino-4-deoxy-L-arabinose transferase-like glycosyltransferase
MDFRGVAMAALAVRLTPLLRAGEHWAVLDDSYDYLALRKGLIAGCGFARWTSAGCAPPELFRTPGYPLLLAILPDNLRLVVAIQALFSAATCLVIGFFSHRQWGFKAGVIAEALLALDVPSIVVSASIMSDMLFQALLTVAVVLQLYAMRRAHHDAKTAYMIMIAALLLAVALIVRPIGVVLPLFAVAPVLLISAMTRTGRLCLSVAAAAVPLLMMAVWMARNSSVGGIWTLSTVGVYNLYYYRSAGVLSYATGTSLAEVQTLLARNLGLSHPSPFLSPAVYHEMLRGSAHILLSNALATAVLSLRILIWLAIVPDRANLNAILGTNARSSQFLVASSDIVLRLKDLLHSPTLTVLVLLQMALIAFVWIGVGRAMIEIRGRKRQDVVMLMYLLCIALVMLFLAAGPEAIARYRAPAMPFLAMLAGVGWSGASKTPEAAENRP